MQAIYPHPTALVAMVTTSETPKRFDEHGQRVTDCCGSYSTFMDDGRDYRLCCKRCYQPVSTGEGDGTEFAPGVTPEAYYKAAFAEGA